MGTIKQQATSGGGLRAYQRLVVGRQGVLWLLRYEIGQWLAVVPGATGIAARKMLLGKVLGTEISGATIGRSVTIRHPHRLRVGHGTVIDELCSFDASGDRDDSIVIGDRAMLARNCKLSAKGGSVRIGNKCGLGANTTIHAPIGARIEIGEATVIGPGCFVGGSNYNTDDLDTPIGEQGYQQHTGIRVGQWAWLGAGVIVLDGVTIGDGAVVGAGAVVTGDLPPNSISRGVPARVVSMRGEEGDDLPAAIKIADRA